MTSGVPKEYHGGTLGVPQWYQSTAGSFFPLHATHCTSKTICGRTRRLYFLVGERLPLHDQLKPFRPLLCSSRSAVDSVLIICWASNHANGSLL